MSAFPAPPRSRPRLPAAWLVGASVVVLWAAVATLWPHLVPYAPDVQRPQDRFLPPSGEHWLGTDQFGRDVLSRALAGARPVLQVAPAATALAVLAGTVLGLLAGGVGGRLDEVVMRIVDAVVVFPAIVAAVLFAAMLGHSTSVLVLVVAASLATLVTRSVRAAALVERNKPYAEAARLRGEPLWSLLVREILPNIRSTVYVEATSRLGDAVFAAATLSFLGLGLPPGSPEWGASVADNRVWLANAPWTVLAPALAIVSLVVGVALVADGSRRMTGDGA
ncbi:ABC transporter permease [Streptomyces sp. TLI_105]|uniref:ABC transporter permease n=1 Tax=Streptomyces sp. TLI_105 TaxID=1881019 RepID=UPI0008998500|nr:ABC transporter permease [Streptomyces sp. TLI_105]SEB97492.1 peptide/nickel transport system permease protein [Streptomyces sp. TLI_105]